MTKDRSRFVCQACGQVSPRWFGRCPGCGAWNTLVEEPGAALGSRRRAQEPTRSVPLAQVEATAGERLSTGSTELDRVLGGGIVAGSLVLVGGDPGVGKSTLLLQAASRLAADGVVLYVSGEESPAQVRLRGSRLGALPDGLYVHSQTELGPVVQEIRRLRPRVAVVDSIQTMYKDEVASAPGSVAQVRECSAEFLHLAKSTGTAIFLVGHVTKDGSMWPETRATGS